LILVQVVKRLGDASAQEDIFAIPKLQLDAILENVGLVKSEAALLAFPEE
jgi:hypothetical protein